MKTVLYVLAVIVATMLCGCRTTTITNHGGTVNVNQSQSISPKATGIPGI